MGMILFVFFFWQKIAQIRAPSFPQKKVSEKEYSLLKKNKQPSLKIAA